MRQQFRYNRQSHTPHSVCTSNANDARHHYINPQLSTLNLTPRAERLQGERPNPRQMDRTLRRIAGEMWVFEKIVSEIAHSDHRR